MYIQIISYLKNIALVRGNKLINGTFEWLPIGRDLKYGIHDGKSDSFSVIGGIFKVAMNKVSTDTFYNFLIIL